ncbi:helix-hairpin-helix domain-containing protein [Rhodococcoides kyotonense]|uniref:Helix-hairpin-helix domain-containing protein n=1 Tax=Rhodococcoides kyotonense TaxID=398843 RepID=A0A239N451_9NOCA|nr:helix-hairpin-helix domain-containing protein [Rhodococcus kyotonensis]SNT49726.1 Helix-hairpin-helix domain-containing protein [Rhodococcus kyotonensis]
MSEPVDHFPKGTGRPAAGAFFAAGYRSLDDLAGQSESELAKLHGVGPKALRVVKAALQERGIDLEP